MRIETARKVTVRAVVEIDLYVAPGDDWSEEDYAGRIRYDLLDTLAYKTGNATYAEEADVVCTAPPDGQGADQAVTISDLKILAIQDADLDKVREEAEAVEFERP